MGCYQINNNLAPLIAKDTTNFNEKKNTLFAFVGEKIEVAPIKVEEGSMYYRFIAKYRILQRVYGNYPNEIIEFEVFDHFGEPQFSKFKNVLLFVSKYNGKYYQEEYMYNDVYKTKDGRWAGTYATNDYGHDYNKKTSVEPVRIEFADEVDYPTLLRDDQGKVMKLSYPSPYFEIRGDKAVAVYGNYIEDLFKLKKDGVLTARGLFGDSSSKPPQIQEVILETTRDTLKN